MNVDANLLRQASSPSQSLTFQTSNELAVSWTMPLKDVLVPTMFIRFTSLDKSRQIRYPADHMQ